MASSYKIGTTSGGMVTLDTLGIPDPHPQYSPYTSLAPLASGATRGLGSPIAAWEWGFLTITQRAALRAYCAGSSAAIYIQTWTSEDSDAFDAFSAIMVWPPEQVDATRRIGFVIEFRRMVAI